MPEFSDSLLQALLLSTLAGMAIPLGGFLACIEKICPQWLDDESRHSVIAFGGGALFSAVALVLVPEGTAHLPVLASLMLFGCGGLVFALIDYRIGHDGGGGSQMLAMLLDFLPEALALGALLAVGSETALVLAGIMFLQNLPEGFNAFRELSASTTIPTGRVLTVFGLLALLGPTCAAVGHLLLSDMQAVLGGIMIFAAGGILYLVFEDIAPQAALENHYAPALGAVAGFLLGLAGHLIVG